MDPYLLKIDEVAARLRMSVPRARQLVAAGVVPGGVQLIPAGRWLVDRARFESWLAGRFEAA